MKFSLFILLVLVLVLVFLAGCTTTQTSTQYSNDVITQSNYVLTRSNPFTDSTTSIRFYLRNLGRDTVPRAYVDFFDLKGLGINSLTCQGGSQIDDHTCEFTNIQSLDSRYVSLTMSTPSENLIKAATSLQISYKLGFDYSGFRRIVIPVIDSMQETEPQNKYVIGDASVGPIAVEFEPPIGAEKKQDDQTIKEYWGVKGDSFELRMNFKQAVETNVDTNITGSDIKLKLQGLNIDSKSKCDFNSGLTAKKSITVGQENTPLTCSFIAKSFSGPEASTVVDVSFSYTFEKIKTETITITPRLNSETESSSSEGGSSSNSGV